MPTTDQKRRYKELTEECGLYHEEALLAIGRGIAQGSGRVGNSRQARASEYHGLRGKGLTEAEAARVVGLSAAEREGVGLEVPSYTTASKMTAGLSSTSNEKVGVPERGRCSRCDEELSIAGRSPSGQLICVLCARGSKKEIKKRKREEEARRYYSALTHPELRGLKGARK